MSYVPEAAMLRGLSYEAASKFGMPHLGAHYRRDSAGANVLDEGWRPCAVCGRTASSSHHEPPRGMGGRNDSFVLSTPLGTWRLRPALLALCGSGTQGCHGAMHSGRLAARWVWHSDAEAERWWGGWYLSHGYAPHDPRLFRHGHWEIHDNATGRTLARTRVRRRDGR